MKKKTEYIRDYQSPYYSPKLTLVSSFLLGGGYRWRDASGAYFGPIFNSVKEAENYMNEEKNFERLNFTPREPRESAE